MKTRPQLKARDKARVQYLHELTVKSMIGDGVRVGKSDSARAAAGEKPAGAVMREVHLVADIIKLDANTGAMTVKGAEGRTMDLRVKEPKVLEGDVAGDRVEGTFLQLLAISAMAPDAER